jgi:alkylation response protein AidB-like acyl-CoA dehydrogenase
VPIDTPGVTIKRNLKVFGFIDHEGHSETVFDNVRVPVSNLIANEGDGFVISQARLGPGRIHHCMRTIGAAERALEMMCTRSLSRTTFGKRVAERSNIQDWIAEARIELEMVRLLTMKTAWLMDTVGNKGARTEIAAIKVAAPNCASSTRHFEPTGWPTPPRAAVGASSRPTIAPPVPDAPTNVCAPWMSVNCFTIASPSPEPGIARVAGAR